MGPEAITKGTVQGKSNEGTKKKSEKDQEMERIIKRIRKARERARRALAKRSAGRKGENEELTPEDWWDKASANERVGWLRAYYAENGGDLKVEGAYLDTCARCAGKGSLTVFQDTGETKQEKCNTCHGTRFKRYFRAR